MVLVGLSASVGPRISRTSATDRRDSNVAVSRGPGSTSASPTTSLAVSGLPLENSTIVAQLKRPRLGCRSRRRPSGRRDRARRCRRGRVLESPSHSSGKSASSSAAVPFSTGVALGDAWRRRRPSGCSAGLWRRGRRGARSWRVVSAGASGRWCASRGSDELSHLPQAASVTCFHRWQGDVQQALRRRRRPFDYMGEVALRGIVRTPSCGGERAAAGAVSSIADSPAPVTREGPRSRRRSPARRARGGRRTSRRSWPAPARSPSLSRGEPVADRHEGGAARGTSCRCRDRCGWG